MRLFSLIASLGLIGLVVGSSSARQLVWPPFPDEPRVEYVGEIRCGDLKREIGWLRRLGNKIAGGSPEDVLNQPFDIVSDGGRLFLTCQNLSALVEIDVAKGSYRLHDEVDPPLVQPIALAAGAGAIYMSDSVAGAVYRLRDGKLEAFIRSGLGRPTGLAVGGTPERIYVVDTLEHLVRIFDTAGNPLGSIGRRAAANEGLNFPTFATVSTGGELLVNDTLNYRIKRYDGEGRLLASFGEEGNGPGAFARAKGLSLDSEGHVYVVDGLFDNVQIFDRKGRLLLVIGSRGEAPGQFWSPGGIDIMEDTIYIADTFNDRIQILRYLGGGE